MCTLLFYLFIPVALIVGDILVLLIARGIARAARPRISMAGIIGATQRIHGMVAGYFPELSFPETINSSPFLQIL